MTPLDGPAQPRPKAASLARGERRYRRKVASPKQWQAIIAAKSGPCRACERFGNGHVPSRLHLHHVVRREDGGDDYADNIIPLCETHHEWIHHRHLATCAEVLASLTDAEYAYMIERGGENYPERAYGLRYTR